MTLARFVGWILLLAGLMVLVRDLLIWLDTGRWLPMAVCDVWPDAPLRALWISPVLILAGAGLMLQRRAWRRGRLRRRPF